MLTQYSIVCRERARLQRMMDENYEEGVDEVRTSLKSCHLSKKQTLVGQFVKMQCILAFSTLNGQ